MNKKMMITTVFLCVFTLTACNKESEPEIKATTSKEKQSNVIKKHEVKSDKKLSDKAEKKIKAAKERGKSLIETPSTETPTTEAPTTEIPSTEVPVETLPQVENQQPEIIEQVPDQNVQDPNIQQNPLPAEGENTIEQPSNNQEAQNEAVTDTTIEAPAPSTEQVQ